MEETYNSSGIGSDNESPDVLFWEKEPESVEYSFIAKGKSKGLGILTTPLSEMLNQIKLIITKYIIERSTQKSMSLTELQSLWIY